MEIPEAMPLKSVEAQVAVEPLAGVSLTCCSNSAMRNKILVMELDLRKMDQKEGWAPVVSKCV